jgi:hypothetical protein
MSPVFWTWSCVLMMILIAKIKIPDRVDGYRNVIEFGSQTVDLVKKRESNRVRFNFEPLIHIIPNEY